MDKIIKFPGLGLTITPSTSKEELSRLISTYPQVKKVVDKLNKTTYGKADKPVKD